MRLLLSNYKNAGVTKKVFSAIAILIGISWVITKVLSIHFGYDPQNRSCLDFTISIVRQVKNYEFKAGEIIAFNPEMIIPGQFPGALLGKLVVGIPGDDLNSSNAGVYINGKKILDDFAVNEPAFIYSGKIPKDSYFGIGTTKGSYDSRYFGFIKRPAIYGVVHPIY